MIFYSDLDDIYCHRARFLLAEKVAEHEFRYVTSQADTEDLLTISPYNILPAVTDRDFFLYESRVVMDYINERYPFPPMFAGDTQTRAKQRLALYRIQQDWYDQADILVLESDPMETARRYLIDAIKEWDTLVTPEGYLMSDEFSMLDCYAVPILWRLSHWGIADAEIGQNIRLYSQQMYKRPAFMASLTVAEQKLRP